jgi:hypothetical protein
VLAKEIIHSRKAVSRLYVNKAQMMSIANALTEQLGEQQQALNSNPQVQEPGQQKFSSPVHSICWGP